MSAITVEFGGVPLVVQFGENTQLALRAAAEIEAALAATRKYARSGSFTDRGVIPLDATTRGLTFKVITDVDGPFQEWREYEVRLAGDRDGPTRQGSILTTAKWCEIYTEREQRNFDIGQWSGTLAADSIEQLPAALDAIDDAAAIQIADFKLEALTDGAKPNVRATWSVTGAAPESIDLAWGGYKLSLPGTARTFDFPDYATITGIGAIGNSIMDETDVPHFPSILAGRLGVPVVANPSRYSSDWRVPYRDGVRELRLTIQGGLLPAGATAANVTRINGLPPSNDPGVNPASFLNTGDANLTTGVSMTGTIVSGVVTRHCTVYIPNAGSLDYKIKQDAGLPSLTLDGPVLFIPDYATQLNGLTVLLQPGQNYFFSGVPNFYGDHTNPGMWEDMALTVRFLQARGCRVIIGPVLPQADWTARGLGTPYDAYLAANARTKSLYPLLWAQTNDGRDEIKFLQDRSTGPNDAADVAAGFYGRSLRKDSTHPNGAGDIAIADFFQGALAAQVLPQALDVGSKVVITASGKNPRTGDALVSTPVVGIVASSELASLSELVGSRSRLSGNPDRLGRWVDGQGHILVTFALDGTLKSKLPLRSGAGVAVSLAADGAYTFNRADVRVSGNPDQFGPRTVDAAGRRLQKFAADGTFLAKMPLRAGVGMAIARGADGLYTFTATGAPRPTNNPDHLTRFVSADGRVVGRVDLAGKGSGAMFAPVGTSTYDATALIRQQKLRRLAARAAVRNAVDLPELGAAGPALSAATTIPAGLTQNITVLGSPTLFTPYGGPGNGAAIARVNSASTGTDGTYKSWGQRWAFRTDSAKFAIQLPAGQTGYRLLVEGQYVSKTLLTMTSAGNSNYLVADFTALTPATSLRRIDLEFYGDTGSGIVGLWLDPADIVQPVATSERYRVAIFCDSITVGVGANRFVGGGTSNLDYRPDGYAYRYGKLLGNMDVDIVPIALPGTGFIQTTSSPNYGNFLSHIADLSLQTYDEIILPASLNDSTGNLAALQAAYLTFLTAVRSLCPGVPIVCVGPWVNANQSKSVNNSRETTYKAAFDAWADPLSRFIPMQTAAYPPQTGFSDVTGNTGRLLDTDNVHPINPGHETLARYLHAERLKLDF
ncbi:SGNH/GDSL hydrolase family protein [Novosphingobium fluoreni]|uniref:SGNH/GDSL hydrolase family protein n=1 Tax=Novosphingobium fluoreni TaxID=1391222 RepID=UPI003DA06E7E